MTETVTKQASYIGCLHATARICCCSARHLLHGAVAVECACSWYAALTPEAIDRYFQKCPQGSQQQTHRTPKNGTDGRADGRSNVS